MDLPILLSHLSPPLDSALSTKLFEEFIDIERRFVLGDWEPATLNGGQFAEIAAQIIYHIDSGNLNTRKGVDFCLSYIEDPNNSNVHSFPHKRSALHLAKTLRTLYKFRSQRGAVHIDPDYNANELDSMLVVSLARWIVSEILRIFWSGDTRIVATTIKEIVRYEVPAILKIDNQFLVMHTDCSVEEEILLLLHNAGEKGMSRAEIGKSVPKSAPQITRAIKLLSSPHYREIVLRNNGNYILTPNGSKRIRSELSVKLSIS